MPLVISEAQLRHARGVYENLNTTGVNMATWKIVTVIKQ